MATVLWHPDAIKRPYKAKGKPWSGGSGNPKFLFHTTETTGLPNYSAPPHMTLHPGVKLWQHIPFNMAAYSVRSGKVDTMTFAYQIEVIGRAREVPMYRAVPWYTEVAKLIQWFHDNLGVPIEFEDFSVMKYGQLAPQRRNYATVDAFSGVLGHAHVGRGIDSHWDPGRLNVELLEEMLNKPGPPPPPTLEEEEMLPLKYGDGMEDGQTLTYPPGHPEAGAQFTTSRFYKRSDVRAVQGMLRDAGASVNTDGVYTVKTAEAIMFVTPGSGADSNGFWFHGNDWAPTLKAAYGGSGSGGGDLSFGDTVKLTQP